jgi:hypothetical protein
MTGYPLILNMKSCWNLTLSSVFALAAFQLTAQSIPDSTRTPGKGYLFPVKPGQINQLAGTMGELRTNHFHGGLDIRTNNQIGVPILATQDGYVSRTILGTPNTRLEVKWSQGSRPNNLKLVCANTRAQPDPFLERKKARRIIF